MSAKACFRTARRDRLGPCSAPKKNAIYPAIGAGFFAAVAASQLEQEETAAHRRCGGT